MDPTHEELTERIGAYLDDELDPAEAGRLEAHLPTCERCRRALEIQRGIRSCLAAEPIDPAPQALKDRLRSAIRASENVADGSGSAGLHPLPSSRIQRAIRSRRTAAWLGWVVAAAIAVAWLGPWRPASEPARDAPAGGAAASAETQIPMVEEALADYRRLASQELPVRSTDPRSLDAVLPFPVEPLTRSEARLIGAWITTIRGEPAGVLAYRLDDHVVVQYVVSEPLFFRQPVVRQAVARYGIYRTADGGQGVAAWPNRGSGTILVGDLPPKRLAELRS